MSLTETYCVSKAPAIETSFLRQ